MPTLPDSNASILPESIRARYFNRSTAHRPSNYEALLFLGRRGLQSAELNELQEIVHSRIDGIAGSLFSDGNIISGAGVTMLEDDPLGNIQLGIGSIYLGGRVYEVPAAKFEIPETGTVYLGLRKRQEVVTEVEDPTLRDPAQGVGDDFDNYQGRALGS